MLPKHLKDPLTMIASLVHSASHSSILKYNYYRCAINRANLNLLNVYMHVHTYVMLIQYSFLPL